MDIAHVKIIGDANMDIAPVKIIADLKFGF